MSEKAIWPLTLILIALIGGLTVSLVMGVDVVAIVAAFAVVGSLGSAVGSLFVYNKVQKVEQQTNGAREKDHQLIRELVEYAKQAPPVIEGENKE